MRAPGVAIGLMLMATQPASAAPVRDAHLAAMAARLFPTLSAGDGAVLKRVAGVIADRRARIAKCEQAPPCVVAAALWSDAERDSLARAVDRAAAPAVVREIDGLNGILQVYGVGRLPRYPMIDGSDEAFGSPAFADRVADAVALAEADKADPAVATDPGVALALALLDANDDGDAVAFEPLDATYNAAPMAKARGLDWSRWRYTAILALGVGPDDLTTPLSAKGKANVRMAAQRFADGLAPFVIVSGGTAHPRGTRFAEAIEMRRALIERFGVPADAIVVEPYARHTTTNLRNATRRLIALGAPLDRDAIVLSNARHSASIEGPAFVARNQRELGYQPTTIGTRLSPNELTFRPSRASLQVDPADPLDP